MRWAVLSIGLGLLLLVTPVFVEQASVLPYVGLVPLLLGIGGFLYRLRRGDTLLNDPRAWRRFRSNRGALAGGVVFLAVAAFSLIGPLLAPHDPNHVYDDGVQYDGTPVGPSRIITFEGRRYAVPLLGDADALSGDGEHTLAATNPILDSRFARLSGLGTDHEILFLLGTDHIGRDQLSRLLHGGRVSFAVAFGAAAIATLLGFSLGLIAGYFGRVPDTAVVQLINVVLSLPFLLVAIVLNRVFANPNLMVLCVLLGALSWTQLARVTRAKTMQVRSLQYVEAARALGASHARIIVRHVVPNVMGPAIVIVTTLTALVIIIESAMSFLGVGVTPPTASWGTMLYDGQLLMAYAPRMLFFPAGLIVATVFGINLLGEGLRDAFDPKE